VLDNTSDAISIGIALFIVSLVAAVQEYRSEKALENLADLVPHTSTVVRDGHVHDGFPAKQLVVGDLILLATEDRVPADCRVIDSVGLCIDESSLTGENHPVSKCSEGLLRNTVLADDANVKTNTPPLPQQGNIAFAGTLVNEGAIVKKLPVVESLGCITVVASDKTGTLTKNEMTAHVAFCLAFPTKRFIFSGVGYTSSLSTDRLFGAQDESYGNNSTGSIQPIQSTSKEHVAISALLSMCCLCNNATIMTNNNSSSDDGVVEGSAISGQPTELALLIGAFKANISDPRPQYHRTQEMPFSSERKRMEGRARPVSGNVVARPSKLRQQRQRPHQRMETITRIAICIL
jgi:magnesium-transporting ATPase (P-type)